jgi:hypothetical protein
MSSETYWLSQGDADFVMSAAAQYNNGTQVEAERAAGGNGDDSVYEITVTRHMRNAAPAREREQRHTSLRSALLADEVRRNVVQRQG